MLFAHRSEQNASTNRVAKELIFNEGNMVADEINDTNSCYNNFNSMGCSAIPILVTGCMGCSAIPTLVTDCMGCSAIPILVTGCMGCSAIPTLVTGCMDCSVIPILVTGCMGCSAIPYLSLAVWAVVQYHTCHWLYGL